MLAIVLAACSGRSATVDARDNFDFLLSAESTHELYQMHVGDGPQEVALVQAALRRDPRPRVRRNAIVALTASRKGDAMGDYIAALDDDAPLVYSEAAVTIAIWGGEETGRLENPIAMATLRAHAAKLRAALAAPDELTRYNVARALRTIVDPQVDLSQLLGDGATDVRNEGLLLARMRSLTAADLAALAAVANGDPVDRLRWSAVAQVVSNASPEVAVPVVTDALLRGDGDPGIANAVVSKKLAGAIPAIVAYLDGDVRGFGAMHWINALMTFAPPCAANALARLVDDVAAGGTALDALRTLAGKPDGTKEELVSWASAHPSDIPPCTGS